MVSQSTDVSSHTNMIKAFFQLTNVIKSVSGPRNHFDGPLWRDELRSSLSSDYLLQLNYTITTYLPQNFNQTIKTSPLQLFNTFLNPVINYSSCKRISPKSFSQGLFPAFLVNKLYNHKIAIRFLFTSTC